MKYTFWIYTDRFERIQNELKDKVVILKTDGDLSEIEVTLNDSKDMLDLFHAGAPVITRKEETGYKYFKSNEFGWHYFKDGDCQISVDNLGRAFPPNDSPYDLFMAEEENKTNNLSWENKEGSFLEIETSNKQNEEAENRGYKRGYEECFIAGSQKKERESKIKEWAALFISKSIIVDYRGNIIFQLSTEEAIKIATELYDTKIENK
jgi:hypothetical protein